MPLDLQDVAAAIRHYRRSGELPSSSRLAAEARRLGEFISDSWRLMELTVDGPEHCPDLSQQCRADVEND